MKKFLIIISLLSVLVNCGHKQEISKKTVTVSVLPQRYFLQQIAGDFVQVNVMIPPGHSPATYAPTPGQMKELSRSLIYFRTGHIAFEKAWMGRIADANPQLKIMDTSVGLKLISLAGHSHGEDHHEGHSNEKHEEGIDPHTWLSPSAVKIQARRMKEGLTRLFPEQEEMFEHNYNRFIGEIDGLDKEIRDILRENQGAAFMVFHPAFGYFAAEYGLEQLAIQIEGKHPSPGDMKKVIKQAREKSIKIIFVQNQFDTNSAKAVAGEIDGKVVSLDPLAEDWPGNLKKMALALKEGLK